MNHLAAIGEGLQFLVHHYTVQGAAAHIDEIPLRSTKDRFPFVQALQSILNRNIRCAPRFESSIFYLKTTYHSPHLFERSPEIQEGVKQTIRTLVDQEIQKVTRFSKKEMREYVRQSLCREKETPSLTQTTGMQKSCNAMGHATIHNRCYYVYA